MTESKVTIAKDDTPELPEVKGIRYLTIHEEAHRPTDPFKKSAEEIKTMSGLNTSTKKRISKSLEKVQRGNGAGTAQVEETKDFMSGYQSFDVVEPPYNLDYLGRLYDKSSIHHGAVDAKTSNIVGLGYKFVETRKAKRELERLAGNDKKVKKLRETMENHLDELYEGIEKLNKEDSFTETLIKMWKDYECTGNGYLEVSRKKDGNIGYVGHIPSKTMRIRKKRDGFVQVSGFKAVFFANFGAGFDDDGEPQRIPNPIGNGTPNEVIHFKKYSPSSGYYGVPDIISALPAITGNEFAQRFNLDYFENKAIPRHVIILKGAKLGPKSEEALLAFFETSLKGQNHRSIFVPLPASSKENPVELSFESIGAEIQEASFKDYRTANNDDILIAHRTPKTKLSVATDGASLAIAKDADKTFKEQVCSPEQKIAEKKVNRLIKEVSDTFELKLVEMTLTDEDTQSQIDERRIKTGQRTPNELRTRDGVAAHPDGDELVDLNSAAKIAEQRNEMQANRERDSARSAGATDSAGRARNPKGEGRTTA